MSIKINSALLKQVFDLLDYDKDDQVDIDEALDNLEQLRYDESHPEICELIAGVGKGRVTFPQFEQKIISLLNDQNEDEGLQKMYDLFVYNHKSPTINKESLDKIISDLGEDFSEGDKNYFLHQAGDGKNINVDTFIPFMKKKYH
jgi:Ca2+-binding EF-hand superfamily protein